MNPARRYQLSFPGTIREVLRELLQRASDLGIRDRIADALAEIELRLGTDPVAWGDPLRRYRGARVVAYHRIHDDVLAVFSVHDDRPEVWLLNVVPVLGHPLRDD